MRNKNANKLRISKQERRVSSSFVFSLIPQQAQRHLPYNIVNDIWRSV